MSKNSSKRRIFSSTTTLHFGAIIALQPHQRAVGIFRSVNSEFSSIININLIICPPLVGWYDIYCVCVCACVSVCACACVCVCLLLYTHVCNMHKVFSYASQRAVEGARVCKDPGF